MHSPADLRLLIEQKLSTWPWPKDPVLLYEPMNYLMGLGGKRMRPIACLMSAEIFGTKPEQALTPALGIEFFHNFTLAHDDIMDQAPLRRGNQTIHTKWDENVGILSGDALMIKAYQCFEGLPAEAFKKAMIRFNQTALEVCEGQQYDMDFSISPEVDLESYLRMIRFKTAVLLGFSFELGGIIAGVSEEDCKNLYNMGVDMGIGFQIHDDFLDAFADPKKFGKKVGGDIVEKKQTFLLIAARNKANPEQRKDLEAWLNHENESLKVEKVKDIFTELGIPSMAQREAASYFDKAKAALDALKAPSSQKLMISTLLEELRLREF